MLVHHTVSVYRSTWYILAAMERFMVRDRHCFPEMNTPKFFRLALELRSRTSNEDPGLTKHVLVAIAASSIAM
jgi:hypothetical protein